MPKELDQLSALALAIRPELQGRLAAIARDEKAVELASKRFYPNITLGLTYMDMEKTNALAPKSANGSPNVGLFVGFNLPVHHKKYQAGVLRPRNAPAPTPSSTKPSATRHSAKSRTSWSRPRSRKTCSRSSATASCPAPGKPSSCARSDYAKSNVDYATVLSALREVLQVQLQIAQVEAELGKALAGLERAVGRQINQRPQSVPAHCPRHPSHHPRRARTVRFAPQSPQQSTPARNPSDSIAVPFITSMTCRKTTRPAIPGSAADKTDKRSSAA